MRARALRPAGQLTATGRGIGRTRAAGPGAGHPPLTRARLTLRFSRRDGAPPAALGSSSPSAASHRAWCKASRTKRKPSVSCMPWSSVIASSRETSVQPAASAATFARRVGTRWSRTSPFSTPWAPAGAAVRDSPSELRSAAIPVWAAVIQSVSDPSSGSDSPRRFAATAATSNSTCSISSWATERIMSRCRERPRYSQLWRTYRTATGTGPHGPAMTCCTVRPKTGSGRTARTWNARLFWPYTARRFTPSVCTDNRAGCPANARPRAKPGVRRYGIAATVASARHGSSAVRRWSSRPRTSVRPRARRRRAASEINARTFPPVTSSVAARDRPSSRTLWSSTPGFSQGPSLPNRILRGPARRTASRRRSNRRTPDVSVYTLGWRTRWSMYRGRS